MSSGSQDTRRRFEQWARNPRCTANAVSAIVNFPMRKVAEAEGVKAQFGQSPFALVRGRKFEQGIFQQDAALLRTELEAVGVLPTASTGLADFRLRNGGGPMPSLDAAIDASSTWLGMLAADKTQETIAAGLTLRIPGGVMLPEATLCIDALAVRKRDSRRELIVGEIKVYPDRGGYTDATQLATSRAQAGIYGHALQVAIGAADLQDALHVSDRGFLVLSHAGSNRIRLRHDEDLRAQIQRAHDGLSQLSAVAQQLRPDPANGLVVIQGAPTSYCEACVSFCERASACRARAMADERPEILGDAVKRLMGDMTLARLRDLIAKRSEPADDHEREVLSAVLSIPEYGHG
jgi:hypothetical protein